MIHFRLRYERLTAHLAARRRREAALQAGAVAIAVLAAPPVLWAAGLPLPSPLAWAVAPLLVIAGAFAVLGRARSAAALAEELDRRFDLADLLVTAVEVDGRGPAGPLDVRLLDDAASALARLERDPRLEGDGLRRSAARMAGVATAVAGLWLVLLGLATPPLPPASAVWGGALGAADLPGGWTGAAPSPGAALPGTYLGGGGHGETAGAASSVRAPGEGSGELRLGSPVARPAPIAGATLSVGSGDQAGAAAPPRGGGTGASTTTAGAVRGSGASAPGAPEGAGSPREHAEVVRRYFER
jgi:hypothetical protein